MISHLGQHCFVTFDAVSDAVGEVQLASVADLRAVEIVEAFDDLGQALLLGILGLA